MAFEVGQRVGDYEILQMLGAGGMGHVYRVRNVISDRIEAMKVLLPDLAAEPDLAVRFIAEIRTLASFDHPNIAQLHTAFQADNQLVMMMEFVEGFTLEHRGQGSAPIPMGDVVQYISQTLSALSYAHARGVVHRDIKPANIMVTSHGIAKLMDFGIAKSKVDNNLTRPGTTMGSLYYMSPEQVRGTTVDARSDLYSIGIVLYELLAGIRPFDADTTYSILNQQLNVQPRPPIEVNPALPSGLNDIILIALAKDPAKRFQSADAFRNALKQFAAGPAGEPAESAAVAAPIPFSPQQPPPGASFPQPQPASSPARASSSSKPLWIATGAVAAVLALVGVGIVVPRYMKTRAAGTTASSSTSTTTDPSSSPVAPTPTDSFGATSSTTPPSSSTDGSMANSSQGSSTASPMTTSSVDTKSTATPHTLGGRQPRGGQAPFQPPPSGDNTLPAQSDSQPSAPVVDANEIEQVQERLVQTNARASAARNGVQQIRSQQEQSGLGMRGDIEAADSRLNSYLAAANREAQAGNTAAAARNLDKADAELNKLEKFLGH